MFHTWFLSIICYLSPALLVNLCPKLCLLNDLALRLKLLPAVVADPGVVSGRLAVTHLSPAAHLATLSTTLSSWVSHHSVPQLSTLSPSLSSFRVYPAATSRIVDVTRNVCIRAQVSALPFFLPQPLTTPTLTPTSSITTGSTLPTPSEQDVKL